MDLGNKEYVVKKEEDWKVLGEELTKFFNKNCYWILWKFPMIHILRAWNIAQKENDHDLSHFLNNIKK